MLVFGGVVETSKTFLEVLLTIGRNHEAKIDLHIYFVKKTPQKKEGVETVARYF